MNKTTQETIESAKDTVFMVVLAVAIAASGLMVWAVGIIR